MAQSSISVVALDLDGTLLRADGTISERVLAALRACEAAGMRVVIATGRRLASANSVVPTEAPIVGHVLNNGGEVRLEGERIQLSQIAPELAQPLIRWFQERWPECVLLMDVDGELLFNRDTGATFPHRVADLEQAAAQPVNKILVHLEPLEGTDDIRAHIPADCRIVIYGDGSWGEIIPSSASKAEGLALLVGHWGLTLDNLIAFGDETNDLEMIERAGIGVAMGNATAALKAVADVIAPTVAEDGVAVVLEALLAGGRQAVFESLETESSG